MVYIPSHTFVSQGRGHCAENVLESSEAGGASSDEQAVGGDARGKHTVTAFPTEGIILLHGGLLVDHHFGDHLQDHHLGDHLMRSRNFLVISIHPPVLHPGHH